MTLDRSEAVKRSVDSLGRLFAVVVGLAITVAVQKAIFGPANVLLPFYDSASKSYPLFESLGKAAPAMIAFIFTIVPFYHGMSRHLDVAYLEPDGPSAKAGAILIDFGVFFLESVVLLALASLVGEPNEPNLFFIVLVVLLAVDVLWGFVAYFIHYAKGTTSPIQWAGINLIAVAIALLFLGSNLFDAGMTRAWALCAVAVLRTVADYTVCRHFYFPGLALRESQSKVVKMPRPARQQQS